MKTINKSIFDFPTPIRKDCVYVGKMTQIFGIVRSEADDVDGVRA